MTKNIPIVLALLLNLVLITTAYTKGHYPLNHFNSKCYSIDDGLPQNSVTDIVIAEDGQMVVATFLGLVAFDGHRFTDYIPQSDNKFPKVEAYLLEIGNDGALYIGSTTNGLYRFHKNSSQHWDMSNGLHSNNINAIIKANDGMYIQNDVWLYFLPDNNQKELQIIDLPKEYRRGNFTVLPADNTLIFSIDNKMWIYENHSWVLLKPEFNNRSISGNIFGLKSNNGIYFIENQEHLFKIENNKVNLFLPEFLHDKSVIINSIMLDSRKQLWLATENHGLIRYSDNKIETLIQTTNHRTAALLEDDDGVIWFGGSNGLCFLKKNAIRNIGQEQDLIKENIRFISVDNEDTVYALNQDSKKGYYTINTDTIKSNQINSLHFTENEMIYAMHNDGENLWIATRKRVAKIVNGTIETLYKLKDKSRSIISINSTLWFSDGDFVIQYKNGQFNQFFIDKNSDIYSMDVALNGDILVAEKQNAYRIHNNVVAKIDLPLHYSSCIHEFIKDEIWVCGEGLWLKKNGINYYFDDKQGLTHGHVHDVIMDKLGNVWAITNVGLYRLLRKDIDNLTINNGKIEVTNTLFTHFTEKDGMKSSEFNGSSSSIVKTSDGKLWFASQKGIVVVDPDFEDPYQSKKLKPFIEHLYIGDNRIPKKDWINIKPNPKTLHFHFGSVFLSGKEDISYRYKLVNYHDEWQIGNSANFASLEPISYQLIAQARLKNYQWSAPFTVKFNILPAWYQTLLFRILAVIISTLLIFGLPLWRIQWLKKNAAELRRLVKQQTLSLTQANKKLEILAHNDELTGIANRREFINQISASCNKNEKNIYLALIDIDDFKAYNDFYGHIEGDECLKLVAQVLAKLTSENCLVARFGGEEFVVLFKNLNRENVENKCYQLLDNIMQKAIIHEKSSVKNIISISVGLVVCKKHESIEQFIERADNAMYDAKIAGKDRLVINI